MKSFLLKLCFVLILLSSALITDAQKNIVISDELAANGEQLPVKLGGQGFGKIFKIRFGDYAVVSSKAGWGTTTTKGNLLGTKSTSNSKEKFSFVMSNGAMDTARVDASNYITTKLSHRLQLSPSFSLGSDELQRWSQNFSAFITINNDTTETWALLMNGSTRIDTADKYEAYLLNGNRKIILTPVSSNKNGDDKRMVPALGYEFTEGSKPLCAVQYYGGGLLGANKCVAWIDKLLDPKMKLILSSAMTAVLQLKISEIL